MLKTIGVYVQLMSASAIMCDSVVQSNQKDSMSLFKNVFSGVAEQFTGMFRRKAFLHWYTGEVTQRLSAV